MNKFDSDLLRENFCDDECWELRFTAADYMDELETWIRIAHHFGYMSGVIDSEDYDHDANEMEKEAWKEFQEWESSNGTD